MPLGARVSDAACRVAKSRGSFSLAIVRCGGATNSAMRTAVVSATSNPSRDRSRSSSIGRAVTGGRGIVRRSDDVLDARTSDIFRKVDDLIFDMRIASPVRVSHDGGPHKASHRSQLLCKLKAVECKKFLQRNCQGFAVFPNRHAVSLDLVQAPATRQQITRETLRPVMECKARRTSHPYRTD